MGSEMQGIWQTKSTLGASVLTLDRREDRDSKKISCGIVEEV